MLHFLFLYHSLFVGWFVCLFSFCLLVFPFYSLHNQHSNNELFSKNLGNVRARDSCTRTIPSELKAVFVLVYAIMLTLCVLWVDDIDNSNIINGKQRQRQYQTKSRNDFVGYSVWISSHRQKTARKKSQYILDLSVWQAKGEHIIPTLCFCYFSISVRFQFDWLICRALFLILFVKRNRMCVCVRALGEHFSSDLFYKLKQNKSVARRLLCVDMVRH